MFATNKRVCVTDHLSKSYCLKRCLKETSTDVVGKDFAYSSRPCCHNLIIYSFRWFLIVFVSPYLRGCSWTNKQINKEGDKRWKFERIKKKPNNHFLLCLLSCPALRFDGAFDLFGSFFRVPSSSKKTRTIRCQQPFIQGMDILCVLCCSRYASCNEAQYGLTVHSAFAGRLAYFWYSACHWIKNLTFLADSHHTLEQWTPLQKRQEKFIALRHSPQLVLRSYKTLERTHDCILPKFPRPSEMWEAVSGCFRERKDEGQEWSRRRRQKNHDGYRRLWKKAQRCP